MLGEHEVVIHVHREINIPLKVVVVNEDGLLTTVKEAPAEEPVAEAKTVAAEDEAEPESVEEAEAEESAVDDEED
jgi:hypothetical protein